MPLTRSSILALDVGEKRIGVAVASVVARLPRPLTTLARDDRFFVALEDLVKTEDAGTIVVGLPRGLSGQETRQTAAIEEFVTELKQHFDLPIHLQDEALTSAQAEAELEKSGKMYNRGDIDALAATYILEDFLLEHKEL
ncbi:MAG TPA: Holliday junction resolvase RuvX [Verrucomicrobiae bacterium]|nr:Holliday junction resolvase RuvX [Verrucomicrobiae bacterium]